MPFPLETSPVFTVNKTDDGTCFKACASLMAMIPKVCLRPQIQMEKGYIFKHKDKYSFSCTNGT